MKTRGGGGMMINCDEMTQCLLFGDAYFMITTWINNSETKLTVIRAVIIPIFFKPKTGKCDLTNKWIQSSNENLVLNQDCFRISETSSL